MQNTVGKMDSWEKIQVVVLELSFPLFISQVAQSPRGVLRPVLCHKLGAWARERGVKAPTPRKLRSRPTYWPGGFHIFRFEQGFEQDRPTTVRSSHTESGKSHIDPSDASKGVLESLRLSARDQPLGIGAALDQLPAYPAATPAPKREGAGGGQP